MSCDPIVSLQSSDFECCQRNGLSRPLAIAPCVHATNLKFQSNATITRDHPHNQSKNCAGSDEDEKRVKEDTTATLRCIPFKQPASVGPCFLTGEPAKEVAIFAKAY